MLFVRKKRYDDLCHRLHDVKNKLRDTEKESAYLRSKLGNTQNDVYTKYLVAFNGIGVDAQDIKNNKLREFVKLHHATIVGSNSGKNNDLDILSRDTDVNTLEHATALLNIAFVLDRYMSENNLTIRKK